MLLECSLIAEEPFCHALRGSPPVPQGGDVGGAGVGGGDAAGVRALPGLCPRIIAC